MARRTLEPRRGEYVYGTAVTQQEAEKLRRKKRTSQELKEMRQREAEKQRRAAAIRRNQARELALGRGYVVFLTVMGLMTVLILFGYLKLQAEQKTRLRSISRLESELEDVRADNAAIQKRIDMATDLTRIKETAMNELGMDYATEDQIVYYTVESADYLNQYQDVQ